MIGYEKGHNRPAGFRKLIYLYVWECSSSFYGTGPFKNKYSQICYGEWKCSSSYKTDLGRIGASSSEWYKFLEQNYNER